MARQGYFQRFPSIEYANIVCTDIMRRSTVVNAIKNEPTLFYRYQIKDNIREDILAQDYYEDPFFTWLIYLINNIIDPYYQWYLNNDEFNAFIDNKFGSYLASTSKVAYYQINWPSDDQEISLEYFNNNLPGELKKYYDPVFGPNDRIISYKRRQDDTIVNTNMVVKFNITSATNVYSNSELIDIYNEDGVTEVGECEFLTGNSTVIFAKNISGNTTPPNGILKGQESNTQSTLAETTVVYENIPEDEFANWGPISWFDYYTDLNEQHKNIQLVRSTIADDLSDQLTKSING